MKKIFILLFIITAFSYTACLQAGMPEKLFEYYPMQEDLQSHGFSTDETQQIIVVLYGGTFIPVLNLDHFQLTWKGHPEKLPEPVRNNNTRVTFSFDLNDLPKNGDGYRLTVRANAIQPEDFTRKLIIQTVKKTEN